MRGRASSSVSARSPLVKLGISPPCAGHASSPLSGCGRSRIAGMSRGDWSRRFSPPGGGLDRAVQLDRVVRALRRMQRSARVRVALELVAQIRALTRQARALEHELEGLVECLHPELVAEQGCGTLTAATIIGRTA